MWRYYLVASELTFRLDNQVVFQFQMSPKQDAVPLTRDYLYRDDAAGGMAQAAE
jgi:cyclopropane-fatty-acyl-phospholipid synthase